MQAHVQHRHTRAICRALCTLLPRRLLAFLREEEERERLEEVERLRPIGTPVGPYMEYRFVTQRGCMQHCRQRQQPCMPRPHAAAAAAAAPAADGAIANAEALPLVATRCKAEPSSLVRTDFGEFTVDNRCWLRSGFTLTQVSAEACLCWHCCCIA